MPSPTCEVKEGAGSYGATTNGVNITPNAAVTIKLSSSAGVTSWSLSCITTDDTQSAATVNSGLTVDGVTFTATFTMPNATGTALRFQSKVNNGLDANGREDETYTTTFVLYTLTNSRRVLSFEETTESSAFGWTDQVNDGIRAAAGASIGGSDNEFQYNNGGAFGGTSGLVYVEGSNKARFVNPFLIRDSNASHDYVFAVSDLSADRTVTLPLLTGNDEFVFKDFTQTLTNKTLAAPTVTGNVIYQGTKLRILSIPGEVQTTTATTAVIASFTMLDGTSCTFDFVAGMKAVGTTAKAGRWDGKVTYQRNSAGAPSLVGAAEYGTPQETTAGDGVTFDVSSNDIRVLATAADADDRNWTCELRVHETLDDA